MTKTEYIEKYLNNELSEIQVSEFETLLNNNPAFKKEVQVYKDVNRYIKNLPDAEAFRKITSKAYEDFNKERSRKKFLLNPLNWKKTAVIAFLLIISSSLIYFLKPVSNRTLVKQYLEHYDIDIYTRAAYSHFTPLEQAIEIYQKKNYNEAIISFSKLGHEDYEGSIVPFLCGISCLKINKNEEAIYFLTVSCKNNQDVLYAQSCWYLALALINNDQTEKAVVLLKQIKNSGSYNYRKAEELLKELD